MHSFISVAAFAAVVALPTLADEQVTTATPDLTVLCPVLDGKSIAGNGGAKYSVSCDWTMEAEGKAVKVEGKTTPLTCMEACDEAKDCYSVNIAADGGCSLISGKEKGMDSSAGLINLFRLPQATSTTSRVQITTTLGATIKNTVSSNVVSITTTRGPTTAGIASKPITPKSMTSTLASVKSATSTAIIAGPSVPPSCDLTKMNLCPACDDTIALDASGKAYHIYCDSSLFTNGTYSVQEALSPEGCFNQCDELGFCMGAMYYDDRDCEIAKGPIVYPTAQVGYTAFLPVASSAAPVVSVTSVATRPASSNVVRTTLRASVRSTVANKTTSSLVPGSSVSILPTSVCKMSSLTCPACDGFTINDKLNQTYTALCTFDPICDSTAIMNGPVTQDQCMQGCDQDGTCLAVLWYPAVNSCHLCQQGLDGGPGNASDFILLVANIEGNDDGPTSTYSTSTSSSKSSTTTIRPIATSYPPIYSTGSLTPPAPYSSSIALSTTTSKQLPTPYSSPLPTTRPSASVSITVQPGGPVKNTTRSASVPNISAAVCPGLGAEVFVDSTDFNFFNVMCDSIFTAAKSHYTTASDFAACVASCTASCDGVQFGYTSRCGLYQGISIVGPGTGWTIAASLTIPTNTNLPFSTNAATTTLASTPKATPVLGKRAAYIS